MTVMDAALRESLKALRLSGMLETLDARLAQAHGGELGHLDFLQVLCQDEITRRDCGGWAGTRKRSPRAPRPDRDANSLCATRLDTHRRAGSSIEAAAPLRDPHG
ncbi:hypothetical protein ACFYO2_37700 [Streptomyces sp. NPDC006602]|uniref:hypothetical protein n=1 Tax=Streptomyces sp. NPDC006602 TaxID=3364751 RepID=UPI0036B07ABC